MQEDFILNILMLNYYDFQHNTLPPYTLLLQEFTYLY